MRQNVKEVVPLVLAWRYGVAQFSGRVSERRVDDPPLPFRRCPDRIAVPVKLILGLAVPLEVADVPRLPLNCMAVQRTHKRDSCVRCLFGLCLWTSRGLRSEEHREHCTQNPNPPMSHNYSSESHELPQAS